MARTACWRMLDGKLAEKVVDGLEVPEGWYDNPRLEENTVVDKVGIVEDVVIVTNVVDEKVSEPATEDEQTSTAAEPEADSQPEAE